MGQSMQIVIDKLVKHQLLDESNKEDMKQFLMSQEDTSNNIILAGLEYFEMMKLAEHNNFSNLIDLPELTKEQQDSTNKEFLKYLTAINSAGLIASSVYAECKANIKQNSYQLKYQLITDLSQKTNDLIQLRYQTKKKNPLPTKEIEEAIKNWRNIGLLKHLTSKEIELSKNKAIEDSCEDLNEVLLNFPFVIHWFDTELENLKDPYAELLKEFSKISHGSFNPINISDNFSNPIKDKVTVKFTLAGKNYSRDFQVQDDWIDAAFIDFVKQAMTENKLAGQFYELYEGGQGANIIFLSHEQYDFLKKNKFLVFAED
jgi:hypothetical protein